MAETSSGMRAASSRPSQATRNGSSAAPITARVSASARIRISPSSVPCSSTARQAAGGAARKPASAARRASRPELHVLCAVRAWRLNQIASWVVICSARASATRRCTASLSRSVAKILAADQVDPVHRARRATGQHRAGRRDPAQQEARIADHADAGHRAVRLDRDPFFGEAGCHNEIELPQRTGAAALQPRLQRLADHLPEPVGEQRHVDGGEFGLRRADGAAGPGRVERAEAASGQAAG